MKILIATLLLPYLCFATNYDFLGQWDIQPTNPPVEEIPKNFKAEKTLEYDLSDYYKDFNSDGKVSIYLGYGKDAYHSKRGKQLFNMIRALGRQHGLSLGKWSLKGNRFLTFQDMDKKITYEITIGLERNEFARSFSNYEIVMYHGHSRNGRGPAFQDYSNYFRMGNVFKTIELDVRNKYFKEEPLQLKEKYPPKKISLNKTPYQYQYRGQKIKSSKLSKEAYTKVIPGMDTDLQNALFIKARQIYYFYSCSNEAYWKVPLRNLFPDPDTKFIFGTNEVGKWSSKPEAVFLFNVVQHTASSLEIVDDLNATKDCPNCFTAY